MKKRKPAYHGNIKCDCGHRQPDHWQGWGWCHSFSEKNLYPRPRGECGCTWFHPNVKYVKRVQRPRRAA